MYILGIAGFVDVASPASRAKRSNYRVRMPEPVSLSVTRLLPHAQNAPADVQAPTSRWFDFARTLDENQIGMLFNMTTPHIAPRWAAPLVAPCWVCAVVCVGAYACCSRSIGQRCYRI